MILNSAEVAECVQFAGSASDRRKIIGGWRANLAYKKCEAALSRTDL